MKKILIVFSLLAALVSCAGPSISVKDGSVFYGKAKVGTLMSEADECVSYCDRVEKVDYNTIRVVRTFTALDDVDSVRLTLDFRHDSECAFAMIPAVCYNGNDWGKGEEPKGFKTDGVWHTYSYLRTPVPGVTYSEGKDFTVAMWGDTPQSDADAYSCSIMPEQTHVTHSLIYPEEERPFIYSGRDRYSDPYALRFPMKKGQTKEMTAYICVNVKEEGIYPAAPFLGKAWELAEKEYAEAIPSEKVWEYGIRYAKEYLWAEEAGYKGLNIGLILDDEGKWQQRPVWKYEVGWCGQNASFANSMLVDYIRNGDDTSLEKALQIIDTWTDPAVLYENGLYVTNYDYLFAKTERPVSDACNMGTAAYNFFEAIGYLQEIGQTDRIDGLRNVALGICNFVKTDQQPSGVYGRGWYPDGECYVREGTVGAFLIAPMIRAFEASDDESYLQSAVKAFDYYYSEFEHLGYTTAGALDTWCIDKESSMPLLRSALMLYDATGDRRYITKAENISYYLSTWLWHYKAYYDEAEDAARCGLTTFGATSVSTQHHHLDVYALMWVAEWIRLAELSGNEQWREKAIAIWTYGCQLLSDGTLEINGHIRPVGSQNEAVFNCNWSYNGNRINDWLVAWPGAFRLETLRTLKDWDLLNK